MDFHSTPLGHDGFQVSPLSEMRTAEFPQQEKAGQLRQFCGCFTVFPAASGSKHVLGLDRVRGAKVQGE